MNSTINQNNKQKYSFIYKIFSGRFILTITCAIVFFRLTTVLCQILIRNSYSISLTDLMPWVSNIFLILSNVFTFYFVKSNFQQTK